MNRIFALIGRLFVILLGYALALVAASAFLHLAWHNGIGWSGDESARLVIGSMAVSAGFLALMFANFAFVPAVIAIGLSEVLGWRDWLTYALLGAGIALIVTAAGRYGIDASGFIDPPGPLRPGEGVPGGTGAFVETIAAGLVGGIAYWLLAGRSAGNWRRPPRARIPPLP